MLPQPNGIHARLRVTSSEVRALIKERRRCIEAVARANPTLLASATTLPPDGRAWVEYIARDQDGSLLARITVMHPEATRRYRRNVRLPATRRLTIA
jgi:hypothetical protein